MRGILKERKLHYRSIIIYININVHVSLTLFSFFSYSLHTFLFLSSSPYLVISCIITNVTIFSEQQKVLSNQYDDRKKNYMKFFSLFNILYMSVYTKLSMDIIFVNIYVKVFWKWEVRVLERVLFLGTYLLNVNEKV